MKYLQRQTLSKLYILEEKHKTISIIFIWKKSINIIKIIKIGGFYRGLNNFAMNYFRKLKDFKFGDLKALNYKVLKVLRHRD